MKRKCKFCNKEFKVYKSNPGKEYCSEKCWMRGNGLDEKYSKHYLGGAKKIKRKKKNIKKTNEK